jgi:phage-related protein
LGSLLEHIASPVSLIKSAFGNLDADLLGTAWNALTTGASLVWNGIKAAVDGVFKIGTGIWDTISGYVPSLFDAVNSIVDRWPFRQLPDFLQRKAKDVLNDIQSLWRKVDGFISDTLKNLKSFTDRIVQSIEDFGKKSRVVCD